jgi:hypothetical protein
MAVASQMNAGNSTDENRPADSRPPVASAGTMLTTMNRPYGSPRRRVTGQTVAMANSAPIAFNTSYPGVPT